jgi:hypothetical protein
LPGSRIISCSTEGFPDYQITGDLLFIQKVNCWINKFPEQNVAVRSTVLRRFLLKVPQGPKKLEKYPDDKFSELLCPYVHICLGLLIRRKN